MSLLSVAGAKTVEKENKECCASEELAMVMTELHFLPRWLRLIGEENAGDACGVLREIGYLPRRSIALKLAKFLSYRQLESRNLFLDRPCFYQPKSVPRNLQLTELVSPRHAIRCLEGGVKDEGIWVLRRNLDAAAAAAAAIDEGVRILFGICVGGSSSSGSWFVNVANVWVR
ncbi:hypothetical protein M569_02492 [Genlisea aurea]|uniref:Uncharacterized protein n=1 Tax=Genlisea aurea TaxID=192259 RepID=S8EHT1_9LAMI|nr:hypothetical protein M569_02492 [Genlisea aurea]